MKAFYRMIFLRTWILKYFYFKALLL